MRIISLGEQIYFTATNASNEHIPFSGGSSFGGMPVLSEVEGDGVVGL